ncbi:hypothetical protein VNO78_18037 [Psophocarpus tetragonolobus]|uniref:Uncharacterized protein n=1 Tax=Psophocarpus tetragonolobus TaxID=3891 RepID=A0AAN9SIL5_PSOTE
MNVLLYFIKQKDRFSKRINRICSSETIYLQFLHLPLPSLSLFSTLHLPSPPLLNDLFCLFHNCWSWL